MYLLFRWLIVVAASCCSFSAVAQGNGNSADHSHKPGHSSRANKIEREKWFQSQRAYPLPSIPDGARARALAEIAAATEGTADMNVAATTATPDSSLSLSAAAASTLWTNIGPAPILDGQVSPLQPVSGRIVSIAVDPTDTNHWLVGASHGGVWETHNAGVLWQPISDGEASLAMGGITFAPSNAKVVYAGTGEATFSGDSYAGAGILKSTNGGANWRLIGTTQFAKRAISDIKVDPSNPDIVLVASSIGIAGRVPSVPPSPPATGIYKSVDGGANWTLRLSGFATDLEPNPTNFLLQYAGIYSVGPYRSTDGGNTWTSISGPWNASQFRVGRVELAIAASTPNTLYMSIEDASTGSLLGVWRSDDAFSPAPTWRQLPFPPNPGDQFFYDHDLLVDQNNPNQLYLAETTLWGYDGSRWTALGGDYDQNVRGRFIHPDQQALAWAGTRLIVGNDGGVWSSFNGGATWINHNTSLSVSTFYHGSAHPTNPNFALAGSQDNGTERWSGSNAWNFTWFGDGADNVISSSRPNTDWAVSSQGLNIFRTRDAGVNFTYVIGAIDRLGAAFISRFEKSPTNDDVMIAGTDNLWRCNDFFSSIVPTWVPNGPEMRSSISALAFAPGDPSGNTYAFGTERGDLRMTTNSGLAWIDIDLSGQVPNRAITDLAFDATNRNVIYVTLSGFNEGTPSQPGHLFRSTNVLSANRTWANISPPVNIPFNAVAVDPADPLSLYVGTDIAMWQTSDGAKTWSFIGPAAGMPNVAIYDLNVNRATAQVIAFTHGRGAFTFQLPREFPADLKLTGTVSPDPVLLNANLAYNLVVTNAGPFVATGAFLTNTLPAGFSFISAISSRGSCGQAGGIVFCNLGALPPFSSASVRITARAGTLGLATNTAVVRAAAPDPNSSNNTNILVSTVNSPLPSIVAIGAHLLSETGPTNGGIDSGEMVSIGFSLQNVGGGTASNLTATLLSSPGIASPSAPQSYGILPPNSAPVSRAFSFTASGTNGETITPTLHLQDGPNDLGEVSFTFGIDSVLSLSNPSVINIPASGSALLYPSTMFMVGVPGVLSKVSVTLNNVSHSFAQDIDALLVAPNGQSVLLMSDCGGPNALNNVTLTFDDTAASRLPQFDPISSGTNQPTDFDDGDRDLFPPPAPVAPFGSTFSSLYGSNPNGQWSLFVFDDTPGDSGRIAGGWRLNLEVVDRVDPSADLLVTANASANQVLAGSNVVYSISVVNRGPDSATAVLLTNRFPVGAAIISVQTSQGNCSNNGSVITCQLGDLPTDGEIDLTIEANLTKSGIATNLVSVSANEFDPNAANSLTSTQTIVSPVADLAVLMAVSSSPVIVDRNTTFSVTVTNLGPDAASGITLTNRLPAGATFVSATPSQGIASRSSDLVTWTVGSLGGFGKAVLSVAVRPTVIGVMSNFAGVRAAQPVDLNSANNTTSIAVPIIDRAVLIAAAGATLIDETSVPRSGGIEPNERVTLALALRNIGISDATAVVGTLRTNGLTGVAPLSQNYGGLIAGGAAIARTFSFAASGPAGSTINLVLDLADGTNNLGSVTFPIVLGGVQQFSSSAAITILDNSAASPYPSTIDVSGVTGVVRKVTVILNNITHGYPDDIDILLVAPDGTSSLVMSDCGGASGIQNVTITLDDSADKEVPDFDQIISGTYRPTDHQSGDVFPSPDFDSADIFLSPAPSGPFPAKLSVFNGHNANGTWSLFVVDDFISADGQIGSWSLAFTTVGYPNAPRIRLISINEGACKLAIDAQAGDNLLIESSDDLLNWTSLTTGAATDASFTFIDPTPADSGSRFYRVSRRP